MHSEKSNYKIGADINLNFLKYQIDTHITNYVNSILSLGCISLTNKPTRFSSTHQPSLLDHIYTNIVDDNTTTGIALYDISDHLPIFANFNFHPKCAKKYIHGPCRRFRGDQNDEDMRIFCGKFLYNAIASTDNAQHKNCPSSGIGDRPGRDLFRVLKRSPISQPHTLGLRRGYSDGKAVNNTPGLRRRLHPHWRISLLQSLCRALGQTETSSNF